MSKFFLWSKTNIASLVSFVCVMVAIFGKVTINEDMQRDLSDKVVALIAAIMPILAIIFRTTATKQLHVTRPTPRGTLLPLLLVGLMMFATGCGSSQSFKLGVRDSFPKVADRLETNYGRDATPLREAAKAPALEKAEAAWNGVAGDYRGYVKDDPKISEFRREQWLETADLIDKLISEEHKYRRSWLGN